MASGSPRWDEPRAPAVLGPSPSMGRGQGRDDVPACLTVIHRCFPLIYVLLELFPSRCLPGPEKVARCQPLICLHHSLPGIAARTSRCAPAHAIPKSLPGTRRDQELPQCQGRTGSGQPAVPRSCRLTRGHRRCLVLAARTWAATGAFFHPCSRNIPQPALCAGSAHAPWGPVPRSNEILSPSPSFSRTLNSAAVTAKGNNPNRPAGSCPAPAPASAAPTKISSRGQWQGGVTDPEFPVPCL